MRTSVSLRQRACTGFGAIALVVGAIGLAAIPSTAAPLASPRVAKAPGRPNPPTAAPGNAAGIVRWNNPPTGGSPITGYRVTALGKGGVTSVSATFSATALSGTVHGLQNGRVYGFTVQATNALGTGPASAGSNQITVGAPAKPSPVKAVRAAAGAIKFTFKAGKDNGAAVKKFAMTCTATGGVTKTVVRAGASAAPMTVTGLTPRRAYRCTVKATNSRGTGPPSTHSNLVTT